MGASRRTLLRAPGRTHPWPIGLVLWCCWSGSGTEDGPERTSRGRPAVPYGDLMVERTLYEALMLHPSATPEVISAAFRALAKRYHPDHDPSVEAAQRMAAINEAYAILRVPARRREYDARLGERQATAAAARPIPTMPTASGETETRRSSAPGAINMRYADGSWSVRPTDEPEPEESPYGEAGPPPPSPRAYGSVLGFGRYKGWSIHQIAARDPDYLEWLARTMGGRRYAAELQDALARSASSR